MTMLTVGRDDSARRVNRNANFKTTEYVIGNGCQYHLTQWYSFDAVRRVVAPYDICNIKHEKG